MKELMEMNINGFGKASQEMIKKFEQHIRFSLPDYWDHSFHFEQSNEEENTYKITDSFQSFIEGLKDPQE